MIRLTGLALLLATMPALADPSPEPEPPSPGKADVRGPVKAFKMGKAGASSVGMLMIDGKKEADTKYDKAVVRLEAGARVFAWKGGKKVEAKLEDIKAGTRVQITFDGPLKDAKSMVVGSAKEVLILEDPKK